jgi:tryptophan halogenase
MGLAIKKIVIVGGGTAGWMAAAALSKYLRLHPIEITLIESDEIGTVGVGEATVPAIRLFNQQLEISETDFIKATQATFKLGIEFKDWYKKDHSFFHPFADYGMPINGEPFYQYWLALQNQGYAATLEEFCLATQMASQGRFALPNIESSSKLTYYNYAYHFDASLYAKFLRNYAEGFGVRRVEGLIETVNTDPASGFITSVVLKSGSVIEGELFVDCSGFKGLLIEGVLKTGYENWSHWLPCDSAAAMQTENAEDPAPFTRSTALTAGWQWKIPLQHRAGNGYVYCSKYISDADAINTLTQNVTGCALTKPRVIKFTTGVRKKFWNKNCVALGLASGFLEPLESTSISLIQSGIEKLIIFFPKEGFKEDAINEANRLNLLEYERIRDFIILHYKSTTRDDSAFWRYVNAMEIPESLSAKIEAFKHNGQLINYEQETFLDASWVSLYNGFNIIPAAPRLTLGKNDSESLIKMLEKMRSAIAVGITYSPLHGDFLKTL